MLTASAFSYVGPPAPAAVFDLLNLWTPILAAPGGAVAFDLGGEPAPTIWRVSLPADPAAALAQIGAAEERIDQLERTLPAALAELERQLHDWEVNLAPSLAGLPSEQRLDELLASAGLAGPETLPAFATGAAMSFNVLDRLSREFQNALEWIRRTLLHYAWVETVIDGRLLARTIVSWAGSISSCWQQGLDAATVALHARSVAIAKRSRDNLIRLITETTQLAVNLAAILAMPGGAILALPTAWKLLKRILAEFAPA